MTLPLFSRLSPKRSNEVEDNFEDFETLRPWRALSAVSVGSKSASMLG